LLSRTNRYLVFVPTPATIVTGLEFGDTAFSAHVRDALARIQDLIEVELSRGDEVIRDGLVHLFNAGGKRFRPLFTVLSSQFGPEPDAWKVTVSGAAIELIHLATLYHDDVMDEAQIRRGAPSANARWGNNIAILAGDYLLTTALRLASAAHLGDDAALMLAETCGRLVTGQTREIRGAPDGVDRTEHYLKVVREKTACLLEAAGWFGATFSGADEENVGRLSRLGGIIGTAFQISDDIIDICSDSNESGKEPGTDLREGLHTLPVLFALRETGPAADRLSDLLAKPIKSDADLAEALSLLRTSRGMMHAKEAVAHYAAKACGELAELPDVPGRDALAMLVNHVVNRHG
jgi:heptaprenyl diphosphate synthase